MTVTETRTDAPAAPVAAPTEASGFAALIGSGDPRAVGRLYIGTSLLFLLVAGVAGGLLGIERADDTPANLLEGAYDQVFSLHSVTGVFLFLVPMLLGLLAVVVPLQVGASTVAFPRALAASYWSYLVGGALVLGSFAIDGGPSGGDADGVELFLVSFALVLAALTVGTVVIAATVLALRAPGMSLRRTPLLSWSALVGGVVWILTFPVLAAILVLLYVDHRYGRVFLGASDGIYVHLKWAFLQPALYAAAVPALGVVGDIVPVFARRRHLQHGIAMSAIGLFGVFAFGSWAQTTLTLDADATPTQPWQFEVPWMAAGIGALVAFGVLVLLWLGTLRLGSIVVGSPLLFAGGALLMLLVGVAQGAIGVFEDLDLQNTSWTTGQAHYVLLGSTLAAFGGIAFWAPKVYGTLLREGGARAAAALLLLGTIVLAFAELVNGVLNTGDPDQDTLDLFNVISAVGGGVVLLAALLYLLTLLGSVLRARDPGDDPWSGHTLEWTTTSPPPVGNFASLPEITSEAPLYDTRYRAAETTEAPA